MPAPVANYSLRVAKLYPRECDDLIPYAGVPTEELARRNALHRDSARTTNHRPLESKGMENVLKVGQDPVEDNVAGGRKRYILKSQTTTIPTLADSDFSAFDQQSRLKTGFKVIRHRKNETAGMLSNLNDRLDHTDMKDPILKAGKGRGNSNSGVAFFSDIHSLQPVQYKNQKTFDTMTKGLGRGTESTRGTNTNVFQYGLPKTRDAGYDGCVEGQKSHNSTLESHLRVVDGYIMPAEGTGNDRCARGAPNAIQSPGLELHLTGGAIPICDKVDSFKSLRKHKKDSLYAQHYQDISTRNQQELNNDPSYARVETTPLRRRIAAQMRSMRSSEIDCNKPTRKKHTRHAQQDQIWDLTMNWQRDQWVHNKYGHEAYETDSWPQIPEKEHGRECVGVYGVLHDVEQHLSPTASCKLKESLSDDARPYISEKPQIILEDRGSNPDYIPFKNENEKSEDPNDDHLLSPCFGASLEHHQEIEHCNANREALDANDENDKQAVDVRCATHILREGEKASSFQKPQVNKMKEPVPTHFRSRNIIADEYTDTLRPAPARFRPSHDEKTKSVDG